jgi:FdhE protein
MRVDRVYQREAPMVDVLDFYGKLIEIQQRMASELGTLPFSQAGPAEVLAQGRPLAKAVANDLNQTGLKKTILELTSLLGVLQPQQAEEAKKIGAFLVEAKLTKLAAALIADNELPAFFLEQLEKKGLDQELTLFVISHAVRPFYLALSPIAKSLLSQTEWLKPYCPVCGSHPHLAKLSRDEGKRYLICSSCEIEWRYPRFNCPTCQNEEPGDHRYIMLDDEAEYQVHLCEKCKSYIKTYDERHGESNKAKAALLLDLETLHLDQIAENEGYMNFEQIN